MEGIIHGASHDLRSPLTVIYAQAQILQMKIRQGITDQLVLGRHVDAIQKSVRRMNVMLNDLLEATRLQSGELDLHCNYICISDYIHELIANLNGVFNMNRVFIDESFEYKPWVWADPDRLESILANVISNAIKYSEEDTQVILSYELTESTDEPEVIVTIADRGRGMGPEVLRCLNEPFQNTVLRCGEAECSKGLGLGLYISKHLVEAHGGRIWAESVPGCGTTCHFSLPTRPPRV